MEYIDNISTIFSDPEYLHINIFCNLCLTELDEKTLCVKMLYRLYNKILSHIKYHTVRDFIKHTIYPRICSITGYDGIYCNDLLGLAKNTPYKVYPEIINELEVRLKFLFQLIGYKYIIRLLPKKIYYDCLDIKSFELNRSINTYVVTVTIIINKLFDCVKKYGYIRI
jgi:hypothetical protein